MDTTTFGASFGDVAENAHWVAEAASSARPFATREAMVDAFAAAVVDANPDVQKSLCKGHPDLAGKAAIAGDIGAESQREQAGAGLDRLTPEEFARFTALNAAYRQRHGIPFIYAVRGVTKNVILEAFEDRLNNRTDAEIGRAIEHIQRIIQHRIEDRVAP
jgi:2-oxo-4-hydroxy-4-carboxy-5-ureidoimidazoline decarboxylase